MRGVLYADGLEVCLVHELGKADANDESNGKNDQTTQDDSDSEDPLGHGLTDEHCRHSHQSCHVQRLNSIVRRVCVVRSV